MSNNYYLRCALSEKSHLVALAIKLGVLTEHVEHGTTVVAPTHPETTTWVEVGVLHLPTGKMITDEYGIEFSETTPKCNADGEPYWHVNLYMTESLGDIARALLAKTQDPALYEALQDVSRYFVTDEAGKPVAPANPALVLL